MQGKDFLEWRQENGLSQEQAAQELGVNRRTVIRYEQGRSKIPVAVSLACAAISAELALTVQTGQNLKQWRAERRLTLEGAAKALGVSRICYIRYESERRSEGQVVEIPTFIKWACAAIQAGLQPR